MLLPNGRAPASVCRSGPDLGRAAPTSAAGTVPGGDAGARSGNYMG